MVNLPRIRQYFAYRQAACSEGFENPVVWVGQNPIVVVGRPAGRPTLVHKSMTSDLKCYPESLCALREIWVKSLEKDTEGLLDKNLRT